MLEFNAQSFAASYGNLATLNGLMEIRELKEYVDPNLVGTVLRLIESVSRECVHMQLFRSIDQIGRIKEALKTPTKTSKLQQLIGDLGHRIDDEIKGRVYLAVLDADIEFYRTLYPFGAEVADSFPAALPDMQEAAKCLALERYTASVFHLMRVMERGVQYFGKSVGVKLVGEKLWQVILDQINAAIKKMPVKTSRQKAKQSLLAQTASHLFNVKLAWRNPVMHPKATYTPDEARDIYQHVDSFMRHLSTIL